MFKPTHRPSTFLKRLRGAKCFTYRLPTDSILPIGRAYENRPLNFDVQIVAREWNEDLERSLQSLTPGNVGELTQWIERGRKEYEDIIAPETVRDRIDPAWLARVQWFNQDGVIRNKDDPKSQALRAAQQGQYDELGFPSFLCLEHVYIDPTIGLTCMLFAAELDVHFENHGFGLHVTSDGTFEQIIDQTFFDLAEHAKY